MDVRLNLTAVTVRTASASGRPNLEDDQLEFTEGALVNAYSDTRQVLWDAGRPPNPATVVREVDTVARFAPAAPRSGAPHGPRL